MTLELGLWGQFHVPLWLPGLQVCAPRSFRPGGVPECGELCRGSASASGPLALQVSVTADFAERSLWQREAAPPWAALPKPPGRRIRELWPRPLLVGGAGAGPAETSVSVRKIKSSGPHLGES